MVGTVQKYRIDSGNIKNVLQKIQENLIPILRRTAGFIGYYTITKDDHVVTIMFCSDPQSLREVNEVSGNWMGVFGPSVVQMAQEVISGSITVRAFI